MLSVLLITRDRAALLSRCLESLAAQRDVEGAWEVVVVDTGSRDATPQLLQSWQARPDLSFDLIVERREPTGAFAAMRNACVDAARGDLLLFTDDDCELPADWVERGRRSLARCEAVGGVVLGGNVLPLAAWWRPELSWLSGLAVPGMFDREAAGAHFYPQTACLAIRRSAFERHGFRPVREGFGEGGGIYLNEREDSALWRRLRRAGARLRIDPTWGVFHATPAERATLATCRRRAWRDGGAEALQRFNPAAARQAAEAIGVEAWGAAGNALVSAGRFIIGKHNSRVGGSLSPLPSFFWAVREAAHVRAFLPLAPKKWRRPLAGAVARGWVEGARAQAKRAAAALVRTQSIGCADIRLGAEPPRRVEIFADAFLGDMILLEPVLHALAAQPNAPHITLWARERFAAALYADCPYVDELRVLDDARERRGVGAASAWSVALVPYWHALPFGLLRRLTGDGRALPIVTFDRDMGFARRRYYDLAAHRLHKSFDLHEIDNMARLFQWGGLASAPRPFDFSYIADASEHAAAAPPGCIAVQTGTVGAHKAWADDRWARLLAGLAEATNRPLVLLGGPDDAPRIDDLRHRHGIQAVNWPQTTGGDLRASFTLLRRAAALVTTCSGPKHIAMAVGCPTVTLYGESSERRWGAYFDRERHLALRAAPEGLTGSERAGYLANHEMLAIAPEAVLEATLKLLDPIVNLPNEMRAQVV